MITHDNYQLIQKLKKSDNNADNELYNALHKAHEDHLETLKLGSHEIKNMLSFMNSSYQLLSLKYPETKDFKFWKEMGDNINRLVEFMNRTTLYRCSLTCEATCANVNDVLNIIYTIPDEADTRHTQTFRDFNLDVSERLNQSTTLPIMLDEEKFTLALSEIIDNCYDLTDEDSEIKISVDLNKTSDTHYITIDISCIITKDISSLSPDDFDTLKLCKPFYTTNPKRSGLGLSMAYSILNLHCGELTIDVKGRTSTTNLKLPICR